MCIGCRGAWAQGVGVVYQWLPQGYSADGWKSLVVNTIGASHCECSSRKAVGLAEFASVHHDVTRPSETSHICGEAAISRHDYVKIL